MDFINKVVLITGGASGIGKTTALHFAKMSAHLSIVDMNEENLQISANECERVSKAKVFTIKADLTKDCDVKMAVDATVKEYGKIDVVVNSAGIFGPGTILDKNLMKSFDKVMGINLRSIVAMTHYVAPIIIETKGSIINVSSAAAVSVALNIPYTVSKASLCHFTKRVALELASKGVRVNAIMPSAVKTNIVLSSVGQERSDAFFKNAEAVAPLKHLVGIEEIAELIAYLASDKAKSMTGGNYAIDSGSILVNA